MHAADSITLFKYLRQLGISANLQARADIMGKIADENLKAYLVVKPKPAPIRSGLAAMANYFESGAFEPRRVLAMSAPEVRSEIEKAAMGVDADWNILNRLVVEVAAPVATPVDAHEPITDEATDRLKRSIQWGRAQIILKKISDIGLDPFALEPPAKTGSGGDWAKIRATISEKEIRKSDRKNAWNFMLKNNLVRYRIA